MGKAEINHPYANFDIPQSAVPHLLCACEYEHCVTHHSTVSSSVEPRGIYHLRGVLCVAVVEFSAFYIHFRPGHFYQLCFLQFVGTRLYLHSRSPVALDSECAWSSDSGSVLGIHVLDGIQPSSLVGMAF